MTPPRWRRTSTLSRTLWSGTAAAAARCQGTRSTWHPSSIRRVGCGRWTAAALTLRSYSRRRRRHHRRRRRRHRHHRRRRRRRCHRHLRGRRRRHRRHHRLPRRRSRRRRRSVLGRGRVAPAITSAAPKTSTAARTSTATLISAWNRRGPSAHRSWRRLLSTRRMLVWCAIAHPSPRARAGPSTATPASTFARTPRRRTTRTAVPSRTTRASKGASSSSIRAS